MRAERAVASLLQNSAGVTAIVGSGTAARIYGGFAPQETQAPLLVYVKQSATREPGFDRGTDTVVVEALIDVLVVAKTYAQLKDLGEAVRLALFNQSGVVNGTNVIEIQIDAEGQDQYEPQLEEMSQVWTFRVIHTE